jgi:hypothetical protein
MDGGKAFQVAAAEKWDDIQKRALVEELLRARSGASVFCLEGAG